MRLLLTTMLVFAVVGTSSNVIPLMQPRFVSHQPLRLSWTAQNSNRSHTTLREHNTQTTESYPSLQRLATMRWGTFLLWNYMMLSNTTQILAHLTSMRWIYILGIWQLAWGRMHSSLTKFEYSRASRRQKGIWILRHNFEYIDAIDDGCLVRFPYWSPHLQYDGSEDTSPAAGILVEMQRGTSPVLS